MTDAALTDNLRDLYQDLILDHSKHRAISALPEKRTARRSAIIRSAATAYALSDG